MGQKVRQKVKQTGWCECGKSAEFTLMLEILGQCRNLGVSIIQSVLFKMFS